MGFEKNTSLLYNKAIYMQKYCCEKREGIYKTKNTLFGGSVGSDVVCRKKKENAAADTDRSTAGALHTADGDGCRYILLGF